MIRVSTAGRGMCAPAAFKQSRSRMLAAALAVLLGVSGCGDDTPIPIVPDPVSVTESFTGTLTPNDAESHPFSSGRGIVTATLLTVTPDNSMTVGFSLGTWNGLVCAIVLDNPKAVEGITITGTVNGTGSLCVRIYDIGTITGSLNYEVRVVHF